MMLRTPPLRAVLVRYKGSKNNWDMGGGEEDPIIGRSAADVSCMAKVIILMGDFVALIC